MLKPSFLARTSSGGVIDAGGHRLVPFALTAADRPDRHRFGSQAKLFHHGARKPVAQVAGAGNPQRFALEVFGALHFFSRYQHVGELHQRGGNDLYVDSRRHAGDDRIRCAIGKLHLVGAERCQVLCAATDKNVFEPDAIFVEEAVIERGIEMHESTRYRASRDAHGKGSLTGLGQIRIGE
jgi:hypothetical protein